MKIKMYSIRDTMAAAFQRPFFLPTDGAAVRMFSDEVNRVADDNSLHRHPEDYALYVVGEFDDETGLLESLVSPRQIITAKECVKEVR